MEKSHKSIYKWDRDIFRLGFSFNDFYPDVKEFIEDKKNPNTNAIKKIQSETVTDLYENYNSELDFESIVNAWNKHIPEDLSSFKEILRYINYNEDVKYKIVKSDKGLQIQQIA